MSLVRTAPLRRSSVMPHQQYQAGSTNTTSTVTMQSNPALDGVDGLTIVRTIAGELTLGSDGATNSQAWVYDAIGGAWELTTVITGTGTAGRIPYWGTTTSLSDSPFNTDGTTVGLGTGQVSGVFLFIQPSSSAGTLAKLSHVGDSGKCLDVISSNTGVIGIDVTMSGAASGASAINVTHSGTGTGIGVTASGDYGLRVSTADTRTTTGAALFQSEATPTNAATTVGIASNGLARALHVYRGNASATQAVAEIADSVANAKSALKVTSLSSVAATAVSTTGTGEAITATISNGSNAAAALSATTNGSGEAVEAIATGTGPAISASITNADSTANAIYATTTGNGRLGYLYRNVAAATANAIDIHCANATDASDALSVQHNGTGIGADVAVTANAMGLRVVSSSQTTAKSAVEVTYDGTGYGIAIGSANGTALHADVSDSIGTFPAIIATGGGNGNGIEVTAGGSGNGVEVTATTGSAIVATNNGINPTVSATNSGSGNAGTFSNTTTGRALYAESAAGLAAEFVGGSNNSSNVVTVYNGNAGSTGTTFLVTALGTARAGYFTRNNGSATTAVLEATSTANDGQPAFTALHTGNTGHGISASITNTSNTSSAINATSAATSSGGAAGRFEATASGANALRIISSSSSAVNSVYLEHAGATNCMYLNHTNAGTPTTGARNFFICAASGTQVWRVDRTGKTFQNGGSQNSGADHAELRVLESGATAEPGDVLLWSRTQARRVATGTEAASSRVAGVYSTRPSYESVDVDDADLTANIDAAIPLGISGIVPCKVTGAVDVGDLLVASATAGHAERAPKRPAPGTVLGKAIEPHAGGTGTIRVALLLS